MQNIFYNTVETSVAAGWLILAVIAFRIFLKNAPKWIRNIMWLLVAVRLAFPFKIVSKVAVLPQVRIDGIIAPEISINEALSLHNSPTTPFKTVTQSISAAEFLCIVWLIGMAAMITYLIISCIKLKKKVDASITQDNGYWICDNIQTPFIFGIVKPKVYLPSVIREEQLKYVIDHENSHLKYLDHIWKLLSFVLLSVHWFNPLVWLAYFLCCSDIELACDERVIRDKSAEYKREYSDTLLVCGTTNKEFSAYLVAFGESGVKGRITSIANYKKPARILVLILLVITASLLFLFLEAPFVSAKNNFTTTNDAPNNSSGNVELDAYIPNEQGVVFYFKEPINENNKDIYSQLNIASKAQLEHDDYEKFIYMIKTAEWVDDRKIDRIAFNFDGYIDLGYRVYFSLEQKILLYENYFCGMREEIYLMLKGNEIKK